MRLNILLFSTLFPNQLHPRHGIFVENRMRKLLDHKPTYIASVVAPIAWFPFKSDAFGRWSENTNVADSEVRNGVRVEHPRYVRIPKIGMSVAPLLLALGSYYRCASSHRLRKFDVIDSHYAYPDGVAAVILGKLLNVPVLITARGSDINVIPNHFIARRWIKWALRNCNHVITVSEALREKVLALDAKPRNLTTIRNGIDPELFSPSKNRNALRKKYDFTHYTVLSVGNLVPLKGHHLVIEAVKEIPECHLVIVGKGTEHARLLSLIETFRLEQRVTILEECSQQGLSELYNAADVVVLASSREGMPNVILESIGCGTPVIATKVGGIPEVINSKTIGILVERASVNIQTALLHMQKYPCSREVVANYSKHYSWEESMEKLDRCLKNVVSDGHETTKKKLEVE